MGANSVRIQLNALNAMTVIKQKMASAYLEERIAPISSIY